MAFSDDDIKHHMRTLRAPNGRGINLAGASISGYEGVETYARRDAEGNGIEPHMAKLRRENTDKFTLSEVGDRSKNHTGRLRWSSKSSD